uniref:NADH dehydrogenase subunit 6 n=1 Tax=Paphia amabilis TaxID=676961 RepID=H6BHT1_9BIVA|nr:NADH dehydrogenase subunit 6 [Paphia amabilis]AEH99621.1 NADH dehydrogenase subunit 6 [Paphia amabilis]
MLEFFLVLCCLGSMNVMSRYDHPMFFGFSLLLLTISMSSVVSFFNGVYGFSLFMCIVSGILVVFAYSIALVPLMTEKKEAEKLIAQQNKLFKSVKASYSMWLVFPMSFFFFFFFVLGVNFIGKDSGVGVFESVLYLSNDWSIGMSLFSVLLFLVMVFCVSVAGKYKGALIK